MAHPITSSPSRSTNSSSHAYDAISSAYDVSVSPNAWMRNFLWEKYLDCFLPGDHILDIACGTGIDALHLARNQICVTGIDHSFGMLTQLAQKGITESKHIHVNTIVADFSHLPFPKQPFFDGAISSFAGLNTATNLASFVEGISALLKPGGHLFIHMLNRFCVWEWLALLAHGRWQEAVKYPTRLTFTVSIAGIDVPHYLYSPSETYYQYFVQDFELFKSYGLGSLRPHTHIRYIPFWLVRYLEHWEKRVNTLPILRDWGDFFLLHLVKR
ncbi:MAG: class I SAM-dependent methyltransferase [Anaerolineales bacterium]|nr:class I SAM-dependent methyltransferase [Anaerolineales bacterium]